MNKRQLALTAGIGCAVLVGLVVCAVTVLFFVETNLLSEIRATLAPVQWTPVRQTRNSREPIAAPTQPPQTVRPRATPETRSAQRPSPMEPGLLTTLYEQVNPGVVNIRAWVTRGDQSGQSAGSGFIIDRDGHIVTNNHVVAGASQVTVIFYDGIEAEATVVGTDADSDLAVVHVEELARGAHPLPLGDSDEVQVGEWVVAIGNPFGLAGSMTLGIVSAVGRTIPSGVARFSIPQAIQTDAAINPGNSGGPLLSLEGEVIGVNAQIATSGVQANAGVGFAIPSSFVRRVAPALIEIGSYQWPWLGVEGTSVNLAIVRANNLEVRQGAYIVGVVEGGPAAQAGLRGSSGTRQIGGLQVPVGGDVVIEADGRPIADFSDLLTDIASKNPGDEIELTVLRDGQTHKVIVKLMLRPSEAGR